MGAHCYLAVGLGVSSLRLRFLLRKVQMIIPPLPPTHTSLAGVSGGGRGGHAGVVSGQQQYTEGVYRHRLVYRAPGEP